MQFLDCFFVLYSAFDAGVLGCFAFAGSGQGGFVFGDLVGDRSLGLGSGCGGARDHAGAGVGAVSRVRVKVQ